MRVLMVTPYWRNGGVEVLVERLFQILSQDGNETDVVIGERPIRRSLLQNIVVLSEKGGVVPFILKLKKFNKIANQYEKIIFMPGYSAIIFILLSRTLKKKCIAVVDNIYPLKNDATVKTKLLSFLLFYVLKKFPAIVVPTSYAQSYYLSKIFSGLVYNISHPISDVSDIKSSAHHKTRDIDFLVCSRLIKQKKIDLVLSAFAIISRKVNITICGSGPELSNLVRGAKELQFGNNVTFVPWVEDAKEYMLNSKVVISIGRNEAYNMVAFEAVSSGCSCIVSTTNTQSTHELAKFSQQVEIFDSDDVDELSELMEDTLSKFDGGSKDDNDCQVIKGQIEKKWRAILS